jgi:dTDP-4-dehydrorhamnose 3,5-epimerase
MIIEDTKISGIKVILSEPFKDNRGFFNRIFCRKELEVVRPNIIISQINHSKTIHKGTIRGMHFQYPPYAEMKIVRCVHGSIFDVAVDLRKNSPTFLQWHGEILSAGSMKALVIPEGCANGFHSLDDDVEILYLHTKIYCKDSEGTIRYDDPKVNIKWPRSAITISEKDKSCCYITNDFQGVII